MKNRRIIIPFIVDDLGIVKRYPHWKVSYIDKVKYIEIDIALSDGEDFEKFERLGMTDKVQFTETPMKLFIHQILAISPVDKDSVDLWVGTFDGATRVKLSESELIHRIKNAKEL